MAGSVRASDDLDRLIHERIRLGIVSALAANEALAFSDLKDILKTSDGNLSVHARKLEEAGYIRIKKEFVEKIPRTLVRLTDEGRAAIQTYRESMRQVIARDGSSCPQR